MACTTILVGKKASYDGSTLVARNEDSGAGEFTPKKFIVVHPNEQPIKYKAVISHVEIELPDNPMKYTSMPDALNDNGIWGACGVNELNISMTATETITSNERVLGADPLVELIPAIGTEGSDNYVPEKVGGIGEEDMVTLVLPYIHSAREGVVRLGEILEKYGTYEMNAIAFQDVNEIWWLETIGGHHWIARRVPDDCYVVMPNQLGLDYFDLNDALGEQKEYMCSSDMREFIEDNHLNLSFDDEFNARLAFGSRSDADHSYNTPRAWVVQRYFNPNSNCWEGSDADFKPVSNDIPWCRQPEWKITVEDIKYVLSNHYQGTPYDPYAKYGDLSLRGAFRPIGVNRTNFLALVQIRPYMPEAIRSIEWIAFGSNVFNAFVPFYVNIDKTPDYFANATKTVNTDSFYWANRLIGALADSQFSLCGSHIERYQDSVQSKGRKLLCKYDTEICKKEMTDEEIKKLCEKANEEISTMAKNETNDTLGKVLYEVSCQMKNGYSRSDA
ncbi:C69 family dipeptidase [Peptoniphilus sp. oral taxon 386]|uniref:C69 family dipeptidase n=1 Tax=Peptoniphilus sp. oral taxon 386 TaxID=652713 RepID=UPI0001DA9D60|nr:C69 family dipeptidase [Peptoniphilus sp. oral taxon 386]EFI42504.1 dipeptidase A [Peptoniphilus sp. oral taxon 386 str. F0131]